MDSAPTITVASAFNGPRESGNGGYSCGLLAQRLGGRAEVSLRSPVPLAVPLRLEPGSGEAGDSLALWYGDQLIAEARPSAGPMLEVPAVVDLETARRAATAYRGPTDGIFGHCFVCGRSRQDSLGVFAGEVPGRELVASPWTPPAWTAGEDGAVRPELVWAVLDCPTYFGSYLGAEPALAFLVRESAALDAPVPVGDEHVVIGWPLRVEGRKRFAGSAVLSAAGEVLARAEVMMVEPR